MANFGLELVFKTSEPITTKENCLVVFFHWKLVSSGFRCLHPQVAGGSEVGSELLPNEWNSDSNSYEIYYMKHNQHYVLKAIVVADEMIFTLVATENEKVFTSTVNVAKWIGSSFQNFKEAFVDIPGLSDTITSDIGSEVFVRPPANSCVEYPSSSVTGSNIAAERSPLNRFPDVGSGDLDPLGRGPGMIMDPRQGGRPQPGIPGNLPPGAVPPGARFDPFGPPGAIPLRGPTPRGGFGDPDQDHLRPPGSDDMFM